MDLILVRHAETEWNRLERCQGFADQELNENGRRQVVELAGSLKGRTISAVYSSDLKRAFDTAKGIADHHGLSVETDPDLREMNQGDLEGLTFDVIRNKYPDLMKQWRESPDSTRLPLGETLKEVQDRALRAVERIYDKHDAQTVVAVSHNLTIITLLCEFTGAGLQNFLQFKLQAASKCVILFTNGRREVRAINDIAHLTPLIPEP